MLTPYPEIHRIMEAGGSKQAVQAATGQGTYTEGVVIQQDDRTKSGEYRMNVSMT